MWKLKWFQDKPHLEARFENDPGLKAQFLSRPEVAELSKMSRGTVRRAIDVDHRLEVILEAAKKPPPQPKVAPTHYPENVIITDGAGLAFHKWRRCRALNEGQRWVARRGGNPAPVIVVQYKQAKARGMEPCQNCFPPNWER